MKLLRDFLVCIWAMMPGGLAACDLALVLAVDVSGSVDAGEYQIQMGGLAEALRESDGLTLSRIREVLATTRKFAVPYCEYLDRSGFTRRDGDLRHLA